MEFSSHIAATDLRMMKRMVELCVVNGLLNVLANVNHEKSQKASAHLLIVSALSAH